MKTIISVLYFYTCNGICNGHFNYRLFFNTTLDITKFITVE